MKIKNKGLLKDPVVYFGFFSFIILLVIIFFYPNIIVKADFILDFSFKELKKESLSQDLFIEPIKNISKEPFENVFIQDNSFFRNIPPVIITPQTFAVVDDVGFFNDYEPKDKKSIIEYIVDSNDTISSIAQKYNISIETILWANNLDKNSKLQKGQKLIILPVSGILYHVKEGDTLNDIARTYKGKIEDIISFNELPSDDIYIGDVLIIPNGVIPSLPQKQKSNKKDNIPLNNQVPIASNYFIYPVEGVISQGIHFNNAIDIASNCGNLIVAAAGGTVLRTGWHSIGGNYITILHPNGVVTYYGHLSSFLVNPQQKVNTGQPIGKIGKTGLATGCHLHFEVRGAKNFLSNLPLGSKIKW